MNQDSSQLPVAGGQLAEIEAEIGRMVAVGCRASQRIAVLVSVAKADHFESIPEWLEWCASKFGFARRTAFQLAAVGGLLLAMDFGSVHHDALPTVPVHHETLLGCDLAKLETLARLHDDKPEQFEALLKHWDPSACGRAEVAAKVKAFLGDETYTLTCGDCHEDWESEKKQAKRCPRCQKAYETKCEREKERRAAGAFERHLTALAELFGQNEKLAIHVAETAPAIAFAAAITAADLAVTHVSECRDVARPELERWLGYVDKLQDEMRNLVAEADR